MRKNSFSEYFRKSQTIGIIYELVTYGLMLLCGYLLSQLLEYAMIGHSLCMQITGGVLLVVLVLSIGPKYVLVVTQSNTRLTDTQTFREYLYQNILDRTANVNDRGEMDVRLNSDVKTISKYFQQTIPKAVSGTMTMFCSAVLISVVDWRVGLIFFSINLLQLFPVIVYEKWTRQIYNQTHSDEENYSNWILEGYSGINTIKAYTQEKWYMDKYYKLNRAIVRSGKQAEQVSTIEKIIYNSIDSLLNYGSYIIIGAFVLWGDLGVNETPLLIILAKYLFSSISSFFDLRLQQFDYQEACKRVDIKPPCDTVAKGAAVVSIEDVIKTYGEKRILCGATCAIHNGDRVLIKGDNGSGKSTLIRIIMGIENPDQGKVIYGIPRNEYALSLQEEVELNIPCESLIQAMVDAGCVNRDALLMHCQRFGILDMLLKPLSELSPGERKKFYLSAALAHVGQVMILDEPTNHLDCHSIDYLLKQLQNYEGTLIVCTHKSDFDIMWSKTISIEGGVCHEE